MADTDEGVTLPEEFIPDLQRTVDFFRLHGSRILQALGLNEARNQSRDQLPVRAILLQDLYSSGYALANVLAYVSDPRCFLVSLVGVNFIEDSKFKIKLSTSLDGTSFDELGTSGPILANSTADEFHAAMLAGFPTLPPESFRVEIGNPYVDDRLIYTSEVSDGTDFYESSESTSYAGCWFVEFAKEISFASLGTVVAVKLEVVQDDDARMRGLSGVVSRTIYERMTDENIYVRDVLDIAKPTPMRAGVVCVAINFADSGYGVIASGYRDITLESDITEPNTEPL